MERITLPCRYCRLTWNRGLVDDGKKGTIRKFKRSPRESKENSLSMVEESSWQRKRGNEESMEVDEFEELETMQVWNDDGLDAAIKEDVFYLKWGCRNNTAGRNEANSVELPWWCNDVEIHGLLQL